VLTIFLEKPTWCVDRVPKMHHSNCLLLDTTEGFEDILAEKVTCPKVCSCCFMLIYIVIVDGIYM